MRRAARVLVLVGSLFCGQRTLAAPIRLTIDDAVARATTANLELNAARKDLDVAAANVTRSKAWLPANPFLSAGSQHTSQSGLGPNYILYLSQELEVGGQRQRRIDAATEGTEKAAWDVKSVEATLAANVKVAFIHALIAADRVVLAHQGLDAAVQISSTLAQEDRLADQCRFDFNAAKIQESRARRDLVAAERTRDSALGTLRRLLGLPIDQEIELAGAPQTNATALPPDAELLERALHQRADLLALRQAVRRSEAQLALTRRQAIPNVTLSASYSRFEGETLAGGDIGVPLPIFQRKAGDVQEAIAERERAALQVQNLEHTITQEVIDARRACADAASDMQTFARDTIPKGEENLQIERRLAAKGDAAVADLIGVQIDLLTARGEQLDALQTYNESLIELERVTGGSIESR